MRKTHFGFVSLIALWLALAAPLADEAGANEPWVVRVVSVQGHVEARKAGTTHWFAVKLNDTFQPGDIVRLHENSRASVALPNETILRLDQNTTITFSALEKQQTWLIDLLKGTAYFFSRIPRTLRVATPFVNGSVEGTEFFVTVEAGGATLSVLEGNLLAENREGSLVLTSGETAVALADQAPKPRVLVRPRDAVQWALHYPFLATYEPNDLVARSEGGWVAVARRSRDFYWQGDVAQALSIIESVPENLRTARFFVYRASLLLSVGRVDRAQSDLKKALMVDPSQGDALAFEAVVALTQNRKAEADELIRRAAELSPNSPVVKLVFSYVRQAHFDLQSAMTSVEDSLRLDPKNALSWARLSDLHLSFGYLDKALEAAQEAVARNPRLSLTQTVLGFAYLMQIKIKESKEAFEKAISLDQADPLPRLGLGLAKIRDGDLEDGRREIEIAVSLAPNNSLMRSYLGKAYYEEKRDRLADDQLSNAKTLDPHDPTPWFYDAIRLQSINRPVEALKSVQKSIELNQNRAVFRSKFLLDEDLAARGARLGSIYRDLGFEQLALAQGWKSVNIDPSNHSAHRLLADVYSVLPRHEIARDSELLQSQLLQPINLNPIRPRLADNGLAFLDDTAPGDVGFNEYSRLFVANQAQMLVDLIGGGENTFADNLILSGIYNNFSYSAGQSHFETDGFHTNNDLNQNIFNGFVQSNFSYQTSLQAEFRFNDETFGDRRLLFFPDNFSGTEKNDFTAKSARFGLRHCFAPNSTFIASYIYNEEESNFEDMGLNISVNEDVHFVELRHLYQWDIINLTGGFGHFFGDLKQRATVDSFPILEDKNDLRHTNLYVYANSNYPRNLILTLGASFDSIETPIANRDQVNPKLGLTWNLFGGTTLRAAVFRTMKRTVSSSQTIEPTQVAGFNQFFDDVNATDAWRRGIALDQQFAPNLSAGVEFSKRDLQSPARSLADLNLVEDQDETEDLGRAYLYWAPCDRLALGAEYLYEKFERDPFNTRPESFVESRTHRVPLKARFYHPSGFFARAQATYVYQDGLFRNASQEVVKGSDDFWVVDLSLGYRLPKRYGIISLGVRNLFDNNFNFQDSSRADPGIISPKRLVLGRITISF